MSAAVLLDRLDRVHQRRPGQYAAACPCCRSRHGRPINVRELDDGRVLLHAWCGCETSAVLAALGLSMTDLFPAPLAGNGPAGGYGATRSRIPAADLLEVISEEVSVVAIVAADMLTRRTIPETDWQRLAVASTRIHRARDYMHG
jgi:hypothetical protein